MNTTPSKLDRGIVTPKRDKTKNTYASRDKRLNKPSFNVMVKKRRAKAKHDKINRRKNRGK